MMVRVGMRDLEWPRAHCPGSATGPDRSGVVPAAAGAASRMAFDGGRPQLCTMSCCSHDDHCSKLNSPRWRRALWIALAVNVGFFLAEIIAGLAAGSAALQADALDFFGDAANYAISLGVAGMALAWRARAAAVKGGTLIAFALWVLGSTAWHALTEPCRRPRLWAWWAWPRCWPMAASP